MIKKIIFSISVVLAIFSSNIITGQQEIRIMAPAGAGGGWDGTARAIQQVMVDLNLVKNVQVSNVPGAGGTIGLAQVVNLHWGDGSQLLMTGLSMVGSIISNKSRVTLDEVIPIARLTQDQDVFIVPNDSRFETAMDLANALREDSSKVSITGGSAGGVDHILVGLLVKEVGGNLKTINYIPYSGGGEAVAEIISGRIDVGVSGYSEFAGQIESGQVKAIAVSGGTRIEGVNVPTLKEQGINIEYANWRGVVAPPGLKGNQVRSLSKIMEEVAKSEEWSEILAARGWTDYYAAQGEFSEFIKNDQKRINDILVSIGLSK